LDPAERLLPPCTAGCKPALLSVGDSSEQCSKLLNADTQYARREFLFQIKRPASFRSELQVTTCTHSNAVYQCKRLLAFHHPMTNSCPSPRSRPAVEKLLDAAAQVFARDGLDGATTREIARTAGVNEVTLFRHFGSKENLVAAVAERMRGAVSEPRDAVKSPGEISMARIDGYQGVAAILARFAYTKYSLLSEHLPLIRTFIGEIHRHQPRKHELLNTIFYPHRQQLIEDLREAQTKGLIRHDVHIELAADQLSGMIFANVLRQSVSCPKDYETEEYLVACINLVAESIQVPTGSAQKIRTKAARSTATNKKVKRK